MSLPDCCNFFKPRMRVGEEEKEMRDLRKEEKVGKNHIERQKEIH